MTVKTLIVPIGILLFLASGASECAMPKQVEEKTPQQVHEFFRAQHRKVVSFFGYSGAEYEDHAGMLAQARQALSHFDPHKTIVNVGATGVGIGAVYELAKEKGFTTTGIVSSQAREQDVPLSPSVDYVFYVQDSTWGGYLPGTAKLSPTSEAMVNSSDVLIAIGGGDVARDELLEARRRKKDVKFFPADMSHRLARDAAASKNKPEPTDFRGAVHMALSAVD